MKKRIAAVTLFFIILIMSATALIVQKSTPDNTSDANGELIIAANEVEQLINMGETEKAAEKASALKNTIRSHEQPASNNKNADIICLTSCLFTVVVFAYVIILYCARMIK